jgi:predicted AAA+ superfamily ATPase
MENYLPRAITALFHKRLQPGKVVILLGARRVGKTVFLKKLQQEMQETPCLFLNGEDMATREILERRTVLNYTRLLGKTRFLIIDEAQKVPEIGSILKLMIDHLPDLRIVATGSSAFDLSGKLGEPLTGRSFTLQMFPFAQMEYSVKENIIESRARLDERLIFGGYPELYSLSTDEEKAVYLRELVNSYLLKDILEFEDLRNSDKMLALLRLIAFQIGKEVSLDELGRQLSISKNTVGKYLDLLAKVFIIFKLPGFSRNLRSEVTKMNRWYFYDNGIRNTLIANLNPLALRNDAGELWENYIISERIKYQQYTGVMANNYFWRTYEQHEIDWIEESGGSLHAFEMKWKVSKKASVPKLWKTAYPDATFQTITPENYLEWITPED